jgi:hypothetical protein
MRRVLVAMTAAVVTLVVGAVPVWACGGLIGPNGTVNLVKTTTLAAYHQGVEHYVTSFRFAGTGGAFGSIVPLPGVPSNVERGGDWTLQRLVREVAPPTLNLSADSAVRETAAAAPAEVLLETRVDALDLTVLKGGGRAVGEWATANGFNLTPDSPQVLDFYAERSPIFLAARFDADAARDRNLSLGDGIPIHLTIPTTNPWVPLRILGLGRTPAERIDADVFLLTDRRPALLAGEDSEGLTVERQERASETLLTDLRSDKGMEWVPESMWLSYLKVAASPGELTYDLAVDVSGEDRPSRRAAGLDLLSTTTGGEQESDGGIRGTGIVLVLAGVGGLAAAVGGGVLLGRRAR